MEPSDNQAPTHIVVIGASAGGLTALESFFNYLPSKTGLAFVVVQHLSPNHRSIMDELLARYTKMPVNNVSDGTELHKDRIYLMPPNTEMKFSEGKLALCPRPKNALSLPIDIFMKSLAEEAGERAIAVILSGSGSDGAIGVRAVHAEGGLVLCHNPETAHFDGMPQSAIASGAVDRVLEPEDMPALILDYIKHASSLPVTDDTQPQNGHELYAPIHEMLQHRFNVNFRLYKPSTINRRIERRIALLGVKGLDQYTERVIHDADEQKSLYMDLLIGVTEFFRNPEVWESLANNVLPNLCANVSHDSELRVWVPGCASGEEAYTLAILISEELQRQGKPINVRIFATDIHDAPLKTASLGIYSYSSLNSMDRNLLNKYFSQYDDFNYEVSKEIRKIVVFARQDLLSEPPFTNIDLICCRNVLIYFTPDAHRIAIRAFHFSLRLNGYLLLGPSETISNYPEEFGVVDKIKRIFTKIHNTRLLPKENKYQLPNRPSNKLEDIDFDQTRTNVKRSGSLLIRTPEIIRAYDKVLEHYVPCSVLVDDVGNMIHSFGNANRFLTVPTGFASNNLTRIAHADLRMAISTGLMRARKEHNPVTYNSILVRLNPDEEIMMAVTVERITTTGDKAFYLVLMDENRTIESEQIETGRFTPSISPASETGDDQHQGSRLAQDQISQLEQELHYTRENLQSTVEELETSYEELQSTNEELMASNEELQSTNEELHSVNEELHTVNQEYEEKIQELSLLTSDINNLLNCTDIGTIFLDKYFNIRKFTPAAASVFNLLNQDIGRPIIHLRRNFQVPDFEELLERANKSDTSLEREIRDNDGNYMIMAIHPFINQARLRDGIILTFVNINTIKEQEFLRLKHEKLQDYAYAVSHDMNEPLRNVASLSRMLISDLELTQEQQETAAVLSDSVQRLSAMHQGMLEYSRVHTRGQNMELHDLDVVASRAIRHLAETIEKANASVKIEPLPAVYCDDRQMQTVFEELINNALRFNQSRTPSVRVSCMSEANHHIISFQDNGIGIDPDQSEEVFRIFSRLNHRQDYPGMGVGLALVERIIERHDGLINCEPAPEGGSVFRLVFPKNPSSAD